MPFRPGDGLTIEVDSREFHERAFERDRARQTNYDRLGYRWVAFTPNQIERSPLLVAQTSRPSDTAVGAATDHSIARKGDFPAETWGETR